MDNKINSESYFEIVVPKIGMSYFPESVELEYIFVPKKIFKFGSIQSETYNK